MHQPAGQKSWCGIRRTTAGFPCHEYDLTAEGVLLVLRIGVLGGRLPSRDQQPRKLGLRLLRPSFDELDQKFPFVAVVEEESHLGPDRRKGLDDTRPLDAPCVSFALSDIDKELIPDGRIVNVSLQLAVEAERMVEVEIEGADNRLCEAVEAACACDRCPDRFSTLAKREKRGSRT